MAYDPDNVFAKILRGDREEPAAVVREGADLVFHLLVLLADAGATPADLYAELARREGVSGIDEKAARPGGQGADEQS